VSFCHISFIGIKIVKLCVNKEIFLIKEACNYLKINIKNMKSRDELMTVAQLSEFLKVINAWFSLTTFMILPGSSF